MQYLKVLFLGFLLTSCSMMLPNFITKPKEYVSNGSKIEAIKYDHLLELEYKTKVVLDAEEIKEAELRRLPEPDLSSPEGGILYLTVYTATIETANTEYWEVIVETLDGREIARRKGSSNVASYMILYDSTFWYNSMVVFVPEPIDEAFRVYVYDDINMKRSEFIVTPGVDE